jgi:hypothetical protein
MVEFATLLSNDEDRVDAYHDDKPLCYPIMDILTEQPIFGLAMHDFEAELHLAHYDGEPCSFAGVEGDTA